MKACALWFEGSQVRLEGEFAAVRIALTSTLTEASRLKPDPGLNERAEWEFGSGSVLQSLQRLS